MNKSGFQEMRMKSRADGARAELGSRRLCVCVRAEGRAGSRSSGGAGDGLCQEYSMLPKQPKRQGLLRLSWLL